MRARGNCCDYGIQQDADCGRANICPLLFGEQREGERRLRDCPRLSLQRGRGRWWGWRRWRSQEMAGGKQKRPRWVCWGGTGVCLCPGEHPHLCAVWVL